MACNLCDLGAKTLAQFRPVGSNNPDVYIVLDKPAEDEFRFGDLTTGVRGQYIINALKSVGIDNYRMFSIIRCSCDRNPTPGEISQCLKFIESDIYRTNPKVIITAGSLATQALLGTNDKITNIRGLVRNLDVKGKKFQVVPIYSPTYVMNKYSNSEVVGEFMSDLAVAAKIVTGEYHNPMDRNIIEYALDYDTFYNFYDNNLKGEEMLAYDIETNAKLVYSKDFDICGWSLAKEGVGIYVCLDSLDYHMPEPDRQQCIDLLLKVLDETPKIVVHNSLYERPATYFRYGYELSFEKIEDTLVMAKIMLGGKVGAGLKPNARRIGYPEWDKDLAQYIEGFTKAIKRSSLKRFQPIIQELRNGATFNNVFEILNDKKYDEIQEFFEKYIKESTLRYYNESEFEQLVPEISRKFVEGYDNGFTQVIPYDWVPQRMLCRYGATDSLATFDLYNYFMRRFDEDSTDEVDLHKGYYYDLMEHNTGYELMLAGIHWDDESATRDYRAYSDMMLKSLRAMILCDHPAMNDFILRKFIPTLAPPYIYENYNDYFWGNFKNRIEMKDESTYVMVDISPTTGKERRRDTKFFFNDTSRIPDSIKRDLSKKILPEAKKIIDKMDVDELKGIFNPASTVSVIADTYNNIVLDDDLRVGNFINKLRDNILKSEEIDRSKYPEEERDLLDYIEKYLDIPVDDLDNRRSMYEPLKSYILSLTKMKSKDMQEYLGDMHNFRLEGLSEGSQLEVFESLRTTPMNIDDPSTWTDPFKWNFYLRMYKKSSKIITAYLDGAVGRGSVYAVNKAKLQSGDDIVYREESIKELGTTDHHGNLPEGDDWLEQTNFGVGTAETGRWRCLSGDTKVSVVGEGYVSIEDLYNDHRHGFQVESVNVYNGNKVIGVCTGVAITGRDTPMVRVTTVTRHHFDCTPEHKVLMHDRSYKRACDLLYGDILYNDVVVGDVEKIDNCELVYDLSVDGFHNFTIDGNVVVHNSAYHVIPAGSTVKRLLTSRFPGGTIFQPDFSANELRCVASLAHEESMLKAFRDGIDIHKSNASRVFGVPPEEITPFQRRWAKTLSFQVLYGGGVHSVAQNYFNGDMKRAQEALDAFYGAFPGLSAWLESKHDEVLKTHKVSTMTQRFINIDFDPNDQQSKARALRASGNYPVQSFDYDTEITGLDGRSHKIGELADNHEDLWVYTYDTENHRIIPMKGIQAQCTGTTDTWYEIILDNGESVKVTPEHKMMLRDGTYCRADELQVGQSLMPLYLSRDERDSSFTFGRLQLNDEAVQYWSHDSVYNNVPNTAVHHININPDDNRPENLLRLSNSSHIAYHRNFYEYLLGTKSLDEFIEIIKPEIIRNYHDRYEERIEDIKRIISEIPEEHKEELAKRSMTYRNKHKSESWDKNQREAVSREVYKRLEESGNVLGMDSEEYKKRLSESWAETHDYRVQRLKEAHNTPEAKASHRAVAKKQRQDPEYIFKLTRNCLGFMLENNLPWSTPEEWDSSLKQYPNKYARKGSKFVLKVMTWNEFLDRANEYASTYNHKIVDIKVIHLDKPEPKYDLHVPKYHNFALSCGVFTHNSAASTMAAVIFCDILLYMKKQRMKSKGICFIHDSLESDIYPYELIELTKYQQGELATGAIDYFGIECKADVSMGYSMGHECEMTDIEILDDEYTKAYITLEGFYNDILDTVNHWKLAYHKVEIVEEDLHDQYLSISEMFIARKAFDPTAMNHHQQGKVKIYIQYYNDNGEIEPMSDHFESINIWENAPVYKYVESLNY